MRTPLRLASVSILASILGTQPTIATDQSRPSASAQRDATISGSVFDVVTGAAVPEIAVSLVAPSPTGKSLSVITNERGEFSFSHVIPGQYRLKIDGTGFVAGWYGARRPGGPGATLSPIAGEAVRLRVPIAPQAAISGRITDSKQKPLSGLPVQVLRLQYSFGGRRLMPVGRVPSAATNDRGEYRVFGLAEGDYYVLVSPNNSPEAQRSPTQTTIRPALAPTYYPGGSSSDSAAPISISPGTDFQGADVAMISEPAVSVSGVVFNPRSSESPTSVLSLLRYDNDHVSVIPSHVVATSAPTETDPGIDAIVQDLVNHRFESIESQFGEEMLRQFNADQLKHVWTTLEGQFGALQGFGPSRHQFQNGFTVYLVRTEFLLRAVDLKVVRNPQRKIIGFFVQPPASTDTAHGPV